MNDRFKSKPDSALSPGTALEYCDDIVNATDTWGCHAPEDCGCEWHVSADLLFLNPVGCEEMGSEARVALYAPSTLAPHVSLPDVSLPSTPGESTGYYSATTINGTATWESTAVAGSKACVYDRQKYATCTQDTSLQVTELTMYRS